MSLEQYFLYTENGLNGSGLDADSGSPTFLSWDGNGRWTITFPVAMENVLEIDFSVMSGIEVLNTTATFDGATIRIRAYDESDNLLGSVESSPVARQQRLPVSSVLGVLTLNGDTVKRIEILGPSIQGPNASFEGIVKDSTTYKIVIAVQSVVVAARSINIPVSIQEVPGATGYRITYEGPDGFEIVSQETSNTTRLNYNVTDLNPDTSYMIRFYADTGTRYELVQQVPTTTLPNDSSSYNIDDFKTDGVFLLDELSDSNVSNIKSFFNDLFSTGERVNVSRGKNKWRTTFVNVGDNLGLKDIEDGVLLPFETTGGDSQAVSVTLSNDMVVVPISYDEAT